MSIQSLGSMYGPAVVTPRPAQNDGARETVRQSPIDPSASQLAVRDQAAASSNELSVEAPPGTDPALWSVLTGEERRFFAQARTMGPITYGKGTLGLAEMGLQRGGRLDVRG